MKPLIAITVGDPNGIGPEVTIKSLQHKEILRRCTPLLVGPPDVFLSYSRRLRIPLCLAACNSTDALFSAVRYSGKTLPLFWPVAEKSFSARPGMLSPAAGTVAARAIEQAVALATSGHVAAIVTAPVSKHALHLAGIRYPGQTEMVRSLSNGGTVVMMLVSRQMRVGLITIHLPLRLVSRRLTRTVLRERLLVMHAALRSDWGIGNPRIAVLGLNPHAGEEGDLGKEERDIIQPVLTRLRRQAMRFEGPFPADGFFGRYTPDDYDAIAAMYHDQGLIPLKMSSSGRAVNISVGLPVVRTSPDHGTAFPLAGKGVADEGSMVEAILLAVEIARRRAADRARHRHANRSGR